jgi:hypothetical protein
MFNTDMKREYFKLFKAKEDEIFKVTLKSLESVKLTAAANLSSYKIKLI